MACSLEGNRDGRRALGTKESNRELRIGGKEPIRPVNFGVMSLRTVGENCGRRERGEGSCVAWSVEPTSLLRAKPDGRLAVETIPVSAITLSASPSPFLQWPVSASDLILGLEV